MKADQTPAALNIVGLAAALAIAHFLRSILWPFAAAFVLAVLISVLVGKIVRAWPRAGRWTVLVAAAGVVAAVLLAGAGVAAAGTVRLAGEWPQVAARIDALLGQLGAAFGQGEALSLRALLARLDLPSLAGGLLTSLNEAAQGLLLTLLFLVFMLSSKRLIAQKLHIAASSQASAEAALVLDRTVRGIEAYVWTQTLYGLIVAAASGLVMVAFGFQNVVFWMFALFMLAYIPMIGVVVGSVAPALFALVQFPTVVPALMIFLGVQAIAFVVGNLILPRLVAKSVNIDPVASLMALGVWGVVWGLPGAFLAVPMTLILMLLFAQSEQLRWIAVFISNDGHPLPDPAAPGP